MSAKNYIVKNYLKVQGNLLLAEKLFIANSILVWVEETYTDKKIVLGYIEEIKKFLNGETELFWKDGTIHKEVSKKRGKK